MVISHPTKRALPVRLVKCIHHFYNNGLVCALSRNTRTGTRGLYWYDRCNSQIGRPEHGKLTMHNQKSKSIYTIKLYRTYKGAFSRKGFRNAITSTIEGSWRPGNQNPFHPDSYSVLSTCYTTNVTPSSRGLPWPMYRLMLLSRKERQRHRNRGPLLSSRAVQRPKQQTSDHCQHRSISPMIPLSFTNLGLHNEAVRIRDTASRNQDPA